MLLYMISTSVCSLLSVLDLSAAILAVALEAFSWKALSLPYTLPHSCAKASTTRQAAGTPGTPPTPLAVVGMETFV